MQQDESQVQRPDQQTAPAQPGLPSPGQEPSGVPPRRGRRYRSLFWAIVVIAVGVVSLLFSLDVLAPEHLGMLAYLWPILIIGIGVDLLVGRRSLGAGALVGIVTAGLIVVLMVLGTRFGWVGDTGLKTDTFGTSVGSATSAQVSVDTEGYSATIHALQPSTAPERPLVKANVTYRGVVEFQSSGEAEKTVAIVSKGQRWWWQFLDLGDSERWDIGLDPGVPVDLSVETSSGAADLDLTGVQLTGLRVDMSSGDADIALPAFAGRDYSAALHMSSGDMEVQVAEGARIDMSLDMSSGDAQVRFGAEADATVTFDGSSGQFALDLAGGQAFRIEVRNVSSGDVDLPAGLVQVAQGDDEEGTWETQGYADAPHKVLVIIAHMSSGDVNINQGN